MTNKIGIKGNTERKIDLLIPIIPEMVGILRLTASGIASRMGFSIDKVEDIKVVVAEVCNKLVEKYPEIKDRCVVTFFVKENMLEIRIEFENEKPKEFELFGVDDIIGLSIVNSLVDKVCIDNIDINNTIISLVVLLKES